MADDVQSLKENLENKYEYKIKKQKDEINKLKEFNSVLTEIIEEQKRNNKLDMINKGKSNYQHEIDYLEENKWVKDINIFETKMFFYLVYIFSIFKFNFFFI